MVPLGKWKIWAAGIVLCLALVSVLFFLRRGEEAVDRPPKPSQAPQDLVVAEVNGEAIPTTEFRARCEEIAQQVGRSEMQRTEVLAALKRSILEEMIERKLVLQEAAKRGIMVTDEELQGAVAEFWDDAALGEAGSGPEPGVEKAAWAEKLREMLVVDKLMRSVSGDLAQVTDEEIREYYETYAENYDRPARVRLLQIMVDDSEKAKQIHQQLIEGADFAELARVESLSPDSSQGGEMGIFAKGDLPASIEQVVFGLKPDTISKVVKSDYGFHIFKVVEVLPAKRLELDEAREEIVKTLQGQREQKLFQDWLEGVRDAAEVTVHEDVLARVQLPIGAGVGGRRND